MLLAVLQKKINPFIISHAGFKEVFPRAPEQTLWAFLPINAHLLSNPFSLPIMCFYKMVNWNDTVLVPVISDGVGEETNVDGGPNRNPLHNLNIFPTLSIIIFIGLFFRLIHPISHFLPGTILLHTCYLALHVVCKAFDQYDTSLEPPPIYLAQYDFAITLNKYLLNDWMKLNLIFANSDKTEEINVSFSS